MKKITLITGGERSGKSSYAEQMALAESATPTYVATAHIWDDEFRHRVAMHQARRGKQWVNIEEEKHLSRHDYHHQTVVVDCVTLWATNFFFQALGHKELSPQEEAQHLQGVLQALKDEFVKLTQQEAHFIFVTNEIGMGGVSPHPVQRRFTDLLGWLNQFIAQKADEVVLMVSGIPVKIK